MDYVSDFANNRVTNPAQSEAVRQRLYDYNIYPFAGVPQFSFFSEQIGQGVTSAVGAPVNTRKTIFDTNMELPNALPSGKAYKIESIELDFTSGSSAVANTFTPAAIGQFVAVAAAAVVGALNDQNTFLNSGVLEFKVLDKVYLREGPSKVFPSKTQIEVSGQIASNSATTGVTTALRGNNVGRPMILDPEITLQPAMNFEVLLRYPSPVPMGSGFNGRVGCIFDGLLMRASQ
jgi:hypothetical protein